MAGGLDPFAETPMDGGPCGGVLGAFTELPPLSPRGIAMEEPFELDSAEKRSAEELPADQQPAKKYRLAPPSSDSAEKKSTEELPADQPPAKKYRLAPPSSPCDAPEGEQQPEEQPEQHTEQHPPAANQDLLNQIPEGLRTKARQNFARAVGKEVDEVNIEDVINSKEGVVHWTVGDTPLLAQSPQSQVMMRAIEKKPVL